MTVPILPSGFGEHLLALGLLSPADLDKALGLCADADERLVPVLRKLSLVEPEALPRLLAEHYRLPLAADEQWSNISFDLSRLSRSFLRDNNVLPLGDDGDGVLLAMADPTDAGTIKAVRLALQRPVRPVVAAAEDIQSAIERLTRDAAEPQLWQDDAASQSSDENVEHLRDIALGTPVVRYVNQLFQDAVHARATDIHIEPFDGRLTVRMRIDGMLRDVAAPPAAMAKAIVSRVKILSGLNIAERRLPQDGRARIRLEQHRLDLRVATMPTIYGETVAIRLLDNVRRTLDFARLGFSKRDEEIVRGNLEAPYGLVLVTGPTGSGKTTTLATALSVLNQGHRKILTIEDPIEYEIAGVNQTQAMPEIGLTFAAALRSFLRHDPDVLMVGEMRDGETAAIGIHAALTGHLVLSTLHTNTAAGAIPRLLDMGIDAFLLASCLRCVIGQRLVRVLCIHCRQAEHAAEGTKQLWRAVGCERCSGTGYNDRIVIAEVLDVDEEIRKLIQPDSRPGDIHAAACRRGMTPMLADGLSKCMQGITTPEEVRRVALDV
ncbi:MULTISPECIES: GspE/PulE family protein [Rhodomicrobium]|uniref:GspE/PulE family protein n=1 Tax=Rhodomicrobium TaxID=1068 RepID=UPI000B4A5EF9|nr:MULTISPECIES: GspE/PulE family protein [Rhodomicrobium]